MKRKAIMTNHTNEASDQKKKMIMYVIVVICILVGVIVVNNQKTSGDGSGLISTEYRETRGQRKARVQEELKEKAGKVQDNKNKAAEQQRKTQERLQKLQKK